MASQLEATVLDNLMGHIGIMTPEAGRKISEAMKGKKLSPEYRRKLGETQGKRFANMTPKEKAELGTKISEELNQRSQIYCRT